MTHLAISQLQAAALPAREPRRLCSGGGGVALVLVLIVYTVLLLSRFAPAISEPDDNGYFAQGSLLVTTGHTWFTPQSDAQYIGMHWLLTPSGHYVSRYPLGLAVLIGLVYLVGGWKLALIVNPLLSGGALVGLYLLARRFALPAGWALLCVVLLGSNPIFFHHAISGDSHMGVTCCLVWGVYLLMRWSQEARFWQAILAGAVLGCIPTIRYPDAIVAIGVGVFMLSHARRLPHVGRHLLAACAGAAIPILPLLIRNQLVLGAFWRTGYALTNEQTGFSFAYFRQHAIQYLQLLNGGGVGLLFALGVIGITYMICLKSRRSEGVLLALLTIPILLLYMAYYWAPQMAGATMRFLLPTFPLYVLAGVWMLVEMMRTAPKSARIAVPIVLVIVQSLWGVPEAFSETMRWHQSTQPLAMITQALEQTASHGDVVVTANPQLLQDLDFVRHWKLADATIVRGGGGPTGGGPMGGPGGGPMNGGPMDRGPMGGDPMNGGLMDGGPMGVGGRGMGRGRMGGGGFGGGGMPGGRGMPGGAGSPSPMQQEKREVRAALYSGSTRERELKFAHDVQTWAGDHAIYFVGSEADVKQLLGDAATAKDIVIVKHITLPEMTRPRDGGGPPGMGGPGGPPGGGGFGGGFGGGMGGGPPGEIARGMGPGGGMGGPGGGMGMGGGPGMGGRPGMGGGGLGGAGMGRGRGMDDQSPGESREVVIARWTPAKSVTVGEDEH